MRWKNERTWDAVIEQVSRQYGVPATLVKAVIATESQFNPAAYRAEPHLGDGSVGLMQILLRTARGMGYTGPLGDAQTLTGLFDPATNIRFGTAYLAQQLDRAGTPAGAASAYNGGWKPSLGFGKPATEPVRVCLRRDVNGQCAKWRDVAPGEYANQSYVDAVLSNLAYFESERQISTVTLPGPGPVNVRRVPWVPIAILVGLLAGLWALRRLA
jgi:soluble lytic murein transglycosylase-like protein